MKMKLGEGIQDPSLQKKLQIPLGHQVKGRSWAGEIINVCQGYDKRKLDTHPASGLLQYIQNVYAYLLEYPKNCQDEIQWHISCKISQSYPLSVRCCEKGRNV